MPLPSNPDAPKNMPPIAWVTIEGFTRFQIMKKYNHKECQEDVKAAMDGDMCRVSNSDAHLLRKAYHSALSFTDAQLGRVVKEKRPRTGQGHSHHLLGRPRVEAWGAQHVEEVL